MIGVTIRPSLLAYWIGAMYSFYHKVITYNFIVFSYCFKILTFYSFRLTTNNHKLSLTTLK